MDNIDLEKTFKIKKILNEIIDENKESIDSDIVSQEKQILKENKPKRKLLLANEQIE